MGLVDMRLAQLDSKLVERVWHYINRDQLTELASRLVEIPSRTGEERPIAEFLAEYMRTNGLEVRLQRFDDTRANVVGLLGDTSCRDGVELLFNGHLDTSFTGEVAEDYPMSGSREAYAARARVEAGILYGLGAVNMKGGLAALVVAGCALAQAQVPVNKTFAVAGVAGEIEKAPVVTLDREYFGKHYLGGGLGTRFLVEHGYLPRYAVVGEPTALHISRAMLGIVNVAIEIRGSLAYVSKKHLGKSALAAAARLVTAIEEQFSTTYAKRHRFVRPDMQLVPNVIVGGLESGWPYKPGFTPAIARLYVDLRTSPEDRQPTQGYKDLVDFVMRFAEAEGLEVDIQPFLTKVPGTETPADSAIVHAARHAYRDVMRSEPEPCPPEFSSFSDDTNVLRQHGCEAITLGPAGPPNVPAPLTKGRGEFVSLEAIEQAARIYAALALRMLHPSGATGE